MTTEKEAYLKRFGEDVQHYHTLMQEAYDGVINEQVSKYPVFIFHQQEVTVGIPVADRHEVTGNWSVNVSTLEEFYIKGLVTIQQVDEIKAKISGQPPMFCCLVLSEQDASLVFLART